MTEQSVANDAGAKTSGRRVSAWWSRWPRWSAYAAAAWSLGYGALGLFWSLGGGGFPFGRDNDKEAAYSVLADASAETTAPVIAAIGLVSALIAVMMAKAVGRGAVRVVVLTFAGAMAAALCVVLTDARLLMLVTRIPVIPVIAFTGVPGAGSLADFVPWPRVNLFVLVVGGMLWALAALGYHRRTREEACANCGRDGTAARWSTPEAALRWGRWAVLVAAVAPAAYALTRILWIFGITPGTPETFYEENKGSGLFVGGVFIGLMALGGAALTLGLVQRWGEVYPRWIWFAAGKRVPPQLAIIPGTIIAVFVTSAGATDIRRLFAVGIESDEWAFSGPGILWPLWGVALGVATYAYYLRRRGTCRHCGQGSPPGRSAT